MSIEDERVLIVKGWPCCITRIKFGSTGFPYMDGTAKYGAAGMSSRETRPCLPCYGRLVYYYYYFYLAPISIIMTTHTLVVVQEI